MNLQSVSLRPNSLVLSFVTSDARLLIVSGWAVTIAIAHPVPRHAAPIPALELPAVAGASSADAVGARVLIAFEGVH